MGRRDQDVHFLASKEEVQRIHEKMDELGIRSMGAYLRKMALDGYCINLDLQDVKELVSLLRRCSNNLNQYAKRANETGNIYESDIRDLQERLEEIDIQEKMAEGKSAGYERWAKKYNRKEAARTVCLLKEKGISNYEELTALTEQLSSRFAELSDTIKANEKRMVEIGALQTHINNYSRTRSVYEAYRKSGYSIKFFEEHREEIQIHKAAKKAFDQLPGKKVPTRQSLNEEYHRLLSGKKEAYAEYRQVKKDMQEYLIAKQTVEHILGIDRKNRIITQQQNLD